MNNIEPLPWRGVRLGEKLILIILPLLAISVLILSFVDEVILRRLARLPGMRPIISWLVNGINIWLVVTALLFLSVVVMALVRRRLVNNKRLWFWTGCPQCMERELVRVSRNTNDRFYGLIGVPAYRYACRNCTWRGLRIARREHSPEHEAELEASLMRFDPNGEPPNRPVSPPSEEEPENGTPTLEDFTPTLDGDESLLESDPQSATLVEPDSLADEVEPANHHADSEPVEGMEWLWRRSSE